MTPDFSVFEKAIGVSFTHKPLLTQAFIHRSYINENPKVGIEHNERLEFLGDAVLELIVTDYLYRKYPASPEGELTAYRSAIVNANIIGEIAMALNMNAYLLLSRGEAKDTGRARLYILANTFEALLGALYLDQGYAAAEKFIGKTVLPKLDEIIRTKAWKDPKSFVQEKSQEVFGVTPLYKVIAESGPDHDKKFVLGIYFGDTLIAEGRGKSKQEAEQSAAKEALKKNKWIES